jgi:putative transposase
MIQANRQPEAHYSVMEAADLLVKPNLKLRAKPKADTTKPRPTRPNHWWGIDMTKVMIPGLRCAG